MDFSLDLVLSADPTLHLFQFDVLDFPINHVVDRLGLGESHEKMSVLISYSFELLQSKILVQSLKWRFLGVLLFDQQIGVELSRVLLNVHHFGQKELVLKIDMSSSH
jgi:hypothetical protein